MDRRALLRTAGAMAVAALAGCTGDDDGGGGDPDEWLADAAGDTDPVDRTGSERVSVAVGAGDGFEFDPVAVEVSPGTTVVWEWTGRGGNHNVLHEGGEFGSAFASSAGHTFEHAFSDPGVYPYYCKPHRSLGMKGLVRVLE